MSYDMLTAREVESLHRVVLAASGNLPVMFASDYGVVNAGQARCLVGEAVDIRDRSLRVNDGISDLDIPVRDILLADREGGFAIGEEVPAR
ncbi:hypothetical protein K8O93_01035 [Gordonia bronchialis]|uniref:hypothetical protein n=1 Tax=Gordonia bronchialis TaxID=2054 RepID=UPI001CBFDD7E|nr:hypothetical protein [Gordonia bronchialis]UAK38418.1 hypothetical protein K8O93_01035 [Gordonia bronchialis]